MKALILQVFYQPEGVSQMALTLAFWFFYVNLAVEWHNICASEMVFFTLPKRTSYGERLNNPGP